MSEWDDYLVHFLCTLVVADWVVSVPFWHLETNPIAVSLGPLGTLFIKLLTITIIYWFWFIDGEHVETYWARATAIVLTLFHAAIVGSNVGRIVVELA